MDSDYQPRRSCLSVPASSERFITRARDLAVDEVMLDLEDSVAPGAKDAARQLATEALRAGGWDGRLVAVRVNDATTPWAYQDVISVITGAPGLVNSLILPKVSAVAHVTWLDTLLTQVEQAAGVPVGTTRIEAQIEDAPGLSAVEEIAAASPRLATLIFGPGDFMASVGMRSVTVGGQPSGYPFDAHHYTLMRILVAARANGLQAIDGPYGRIKDLDGLRSSATSVAALGFDGKWVLHPGQVDIVNSAFTPAAEEYDRAVRILSAYSAATTGSGAGSEAGAGAGSEAGSGVGSEAGSGVGSEAGSGVGSEAGSGVGSEAGSGAGELRGAVMLDDEMIDEATRKMAERVAALGAAAGLDRS